MDGDPTRAEDAVAHAFARIWRRYRRADIEAMWPYLRTALLNGFRSALRRRFLERREEERHARDARESMSLARAQDARIHDRAVLLAALQQLLIEDRAQSVVKQFVEDVAAQPSPPGSPGTDSITGDYAVTLLTDRVVSVRLKISEQRAGVMHGIDSPDSLTVDLRTGKPIELTDLVTKVDALETPTKEALARAYPELAFREPRPPTQLLGEGMAWNVTTDGLLLAYPQCTVAACAAGMPAVEVHWNRIPGDDLKFDGPVDMSF